MKTFIAVNELPNSFGTRCISPGVFIAENLLGFTCVHSLFDIWDYIIRPFEDSVTKLLQIPECNRDMVEEMVKHEDFLCI